MKYKIIIPIIFVPILITATVKKTNNTIFLSFGGDAMLGRMVNTQIKQKPNYNIWGTLLPELTHKDLVIVNLENTLTQSTTIVPKVFNFKADPKTVAVLKSGTIKVVNLANNHILDFDVEGLQETLATLDDAQIFHVGAGMNIHEAQKPVILTIKNTRIGIIGATDNEPHWKADDQKPGTNYISIPSDNANIFSMIKDLKKNIDICIVSLHWGPNMKEYPSQDFIDFAHQLIDSGADIIHGHSAHIVQGIEIYQNKVIFYDTGDLIDDYAIDEHLRNDLSFLFTVELHNKKIKRVLLDPIKISNMQVNKASGADAQIIIDLVKKRSALFNTSFKENQNRLIIDSF